MYEKYMAVDFDKSEPRYQEQQFVSIHIYYMFTQNKAKNV